MSGVLVTGEPVAGKLAWRVREGARVVVKVISTFL